MSLYFQSEKAQIYSTLNADSDFVSPASFLFFFREPMVCDELEQTVYKVYGLLTAGG